MVGKTIFPADLTKFAAPLRDSPHCVKSVDFYEFKFNWTIIIYVPKTWLLHCHCFESKEIK